VSAKATRSLSFCSFEADVLKMRDPAGSISHKVVRVSECTRLCRPYLGVGIDSADLQCRIPRICAMGRYANTLPSSHPGKPTKGRLKEPTKEDE
jgi:hypothetical protein